MCTCLNSLLILPLNLLSSYSQVNATASLCWVPWLGSTPWRRYPSPTWAQLRPSWNKSDFTVFRLVGCVVRLFGFKWYPCNCSWLWWSFCSRSCGSCGIYGSASGQVLKRFSCFDFFTEGGVEPDDCFFFCSCDCWKRLWRSLSLPGRNWVERIRWISGDFRKWALLCWRPLCCKRDQRFDN